MLAAVVSISGIFLTQLWYRYDQRKAGGLQDATIKVVARVDSAKNEVAKRPKKRVIWQRVDEDEPLYSGEAVRTSSDAEAKIIFNSGAEVDLDPDSMVVIEDSGDKVNLDFVKGNLFVKGSNQKDGSAALALNTGSTSILLQNADVSLGKSGDKGVDVQVTRGTAEVSNGDKKLTIDKDRSGHIGEQGMDVSQQFFKIKNPQPNERMFLRVDSSEQAHFSWQPVPDEFEVTLQSGSTRANLKPTGIGVPGAKGEMTVKLKPGIVFWKLVATHKTDKSKVFSSPVQKLTLISEVAPKVLSPQKDEQIVLTGKNRSVDFRWTNLSKLSQLRLEVSSDPNFQKPFISQGVDDSGLQTVPNIEEGEYYWRISGYRPGATAGLSSQVAKFRVRTRFELVPPQLKSPEPGAHVSFESISQSGIFLSWSPVPGMTKFKVQVNKVDDKDHVIEGSKTSLEKEVSDASQVRIQQTAPGKYQWKVISADADGKESKPSEIRHFIVEDVPKLAWLDSRQSEDYLYVTPKPSLAIGWQPVTSNQRFSGYRVVVTSEKGNSLEPKTVTKAAFQTEVPEDGLYHVSVEAIDAKGAVLSRSSSRDVVVSMKPLLPAPSFSTRLPATVMAMRNGSATLTWEAVPGARSYLVEVKGEAGKTIRKEKTSSPATVLKDLLPGSYQVSLAAIDEHGRTGVWSADKSLSVPNLSDLKPPAFRKLNIK